MLKRIIFVVALVLTATVTASAAASASASTSATRNLLRASSSQHERKATIRRKLMQAGNSLRVATSRVLKAVNSEVILPGQSQTV